MYFKSIQLTNWRQFYGTQPPIEFSCDPQRPVTLLLGTNGSGKTSLLNAFTWCLFDEFTSGFEEPERLIHGEARAQGGDVVVEVTVILVDNSNEYTVTRRQGVAGASAVSVWRKAGSTSPRPGQTHRTSLAEIHGILAPTLKDIFFLPAESLQTLSITAPPGSPIDFKIRDAIQSMLGFDTYSRATNNLEDASRVPMLRGGQGHRSEVIEEAFARWDAAKREVAQVVKKERELPQQIADAEGVLREKTESALAHDKERAEKWSRDQQRHQSKVSTAQEEVSRASEALDSRLRDVSWLVFADGLICDSITSIDRAESLGKIPPRVASNILDRMLEHPDDGCLICGQLLSAEAQQRVQTLRNQTEENEIASAAMRHRASLEAVEKAGLAVVEAAAQAIALEGRPNAPLSEVAASVIEGLDDAQYEAKSNLEEAKRAQKEFLDKSDVDEGEPAEAARAQQELVAAGQLLQKLETEKSAIPGRRKLAVDRQDAAERDYNAKASKNEEYNKKKEVQLLLSETAKTFELIANRMRERGRTDLERALNVQYRKIVQKTFHLNVADDFTVSASVNDQPRSLSQGEKTALTLAFLGALASMAPQYRNVLGAGDITTKGVGEKDVEIEATYPVVLDAPYSPFDEVYSSTVTEALGELAAQVVVTTNKKALEYLAEIADKIGRTYVLYMTTPYVSQGFANQVVEWQGKSIPYVSIDADLMDSRTVVESI